ncbi:cytochrome c oxidase accessory protein CcoG [Thiothrix fructosivorans]|jgi:cytochrome c oxidase accessory protein FixG|uniref:Cytochrome c oxidase accessory protein CcoG n=1 Tax=Thiothrix fructosivorans TaxID=111770 RepID=A0A8B0SE51_9GAMM|nr:cytochrome c oxidase accessory protein CcoG [Thiothrix fructosivorans]MBO0614810.1 cytochrome c oxidase accessory protein CcoG [Thiothrix fructosivorans]QTX09626.1 cytochrome c oxidase accessory protein CcoG [Thiothrix fructosivorans]
MSANNDSGFYQKHQTIYPRQTKGLFTNLRKWSVWALLGLYYILPWVKMNGQQIVLFDLPARKFHILGQTFWPQDFFYLAVLLILAALTLFFVTALAGRVWCGYACPQTVWSEVFIWIEQWVEGDRPQQIKLDNAPWDRAKIGKKTIKHVLWLIFSLLTGFTFVGYFVPMETLWFETTSGILSGWALFWVVFYGFATYGNAGFLREQICLYMCPYARFQSAMFDKDTLIISYDEVRGEPRGSRKRSAAKPSDKGDCVDCTLCVQVCPTGIDIRDGLQYQCIGCAACIDACDSIMDKMGYERGLVRYTTEHALKGGKTQVLRLRTLIYAALLTVITGALLYSVMQRVPLEMDIIRDRNALFRDTGDGNIENIYTLKVINMSDKAHPFTITVSGVEGMALVGAEKVQVGAGKVAEVPVKVMLNPDLLTARSQEIMFHIVAADDPSLTQTQKARFLGPDK